MYDESHLIYESITSNVISNVMTTKYSEIMLRTILKTLAFLIYHI